MGENVLACLKAVAPVRRAVRVGVMVTVKSKKIMFVAERLVPFGCEAVREQRGSFDVQ